MVLIEGGPRVLAAFSEASSRSAREELEGLGAEVHETTLTQPNLESLFIKLTGRELRE